MRFLESLFPREVELSRCAPVMVQRFHLMRGARGHARIRSVLLPFCCGRCHSEFAHALEFDDASAPHIPDRLPCPSCGGDMSFDDLPEMYLSPLLREEEDTLLGSVLEGGYALVERIGIGGTSRVYRATQSRVLGRNVAVKVLSSSYLDNDAAIRRFENEARIIAHLRHPNTVKLLDFGRLADGRLYLITDFLVGRTLEHVLKDGPLSIERTLKIARQILDSLEEAHAMGVVHRDLKPANIFLEQIASQEIVKVLDFGTAKQLSGPGVTAPMVIFGTPAYMSPEQARGDQCDRRGDLYALGAIMYECITGRPVFSGSSAFSLMLKHAFERPEPPDASMPNAGGDLSRLVMRLLAKDPEARPQSTGEVRQTIDDILRRRMIAEAAHKERTTEPKVLIPHTELAAASEEIFVQAAPIDLHEATAIKDESEIRERLLARDDTLIKDDTVGAKTSPAAITENDMPIVGMKETALLPSTSDPGLETARAPSDPNVAALSSATDPGHLTASAHSGEHTHVTPESEVLAPRPSGRSTSEERTIVELIGGPDHPIPPPTPQAPTPIDMPVVIPPPSFPTPTESTAPPSLVPTKSPPPTASKPRFPAPRAPSQSAPRVPLTFVSGGRTPPPLDAPRHARTPTPPLRRSARIEILIALVGLVLAAIGIAWIFAFQLQ
jgi:serine/threonine-protein kinase